MNGSTKTASQTVWDVTLTLDRAAERRADEAVENARRAAEGGTLETSDIDWESIAIAYRRAIGATVLWRFMCGVTFLGLAIPGGLYGVGKFMKILDQAAKKDPDSLLVSVMVLLSAVGAFGVGAHVIQLTARNIFRPDPAPHETPIPPALSAMETCMELIVTPRHARAPLMRRLNVQLNHVIGRLWRLAAKGGGISNAPIVRTSVTAHVRRVELTLRAAQERTLAEPADAKLLAQHLLRIVHALAGVECAALLSDGDLLPDPGNDKTAGRRLAAIAVLALSVGGFLVALAMLILPDILAPYVFAVGFVSIFLVIFGANSSARPLALIQERIGHFIGAGDPTLEVQPYEQTTAAPDRRP
ncbi:hypothetical protein RKD26_006682 [Streptomyces calvus]|uniref:hypothetical protein n=1 Tax=Streptomyces calvus TaxID=67282 RepID=UPI003510F343